MDSFALVKFIITPSGRERRGEWGERKGGGGGAGSCHRN